jgi:hypothetical protein
LLRKSKQNKNGGTRMKKRMLSVALAAAMAVSMAGTTTVFAED